MALQSRVGGGTSVAEMRTCNRIPQLWPAMAALPFLVMTVLGSAAVQVSASVLCRKDVLQTPFMSLDPSTSLSQLSPLASQEFLSSEVSGLLLAISDAHQSELRRSRLNRALINTKYSASHGQISSSLRSKRETETNSSGNVSTATDLASLTVADRIKQYLSMNKHRDLGKVANIFNRWKASGNEEKLGSAVGSSSSTSVSSLHKDESSNVTIGRFPSTPEMVMTTQNPLALSTAGLNSITKNILKGDQTKEGQETTTPLYYLPNESNLTTETTHLGAEPASMDPTFFGSIDENENSADVAVVNSLTSSARLVSSHQPRGAAFDLKHLDLLMKKLPSSNLEVEQIRIIAEDGAQGRFENKVNEGDFWHSYTYNTRVFNRERLTVKALSSFTSRTARPLSAVFQAHVAESLLGKDADGFLVSVRAGGTIQPFRPGFRAWTSSTVGCPCTKNSTRSPLSCACCRPGACLCPQPDRCGPCPSAGRSTRCSDDEVLLPVDTATALPSRRNVTVIVTAHFDTLAVLESDGRELSPLQPKAGQATRLSPGVAITSLATVDVPSRHTCRVVRRSYILSHRASSGALLAQEMIVDQQEKTYSLGVLYMWEAPGREIKVLQTEERAFVLVQKDTSVTALELKAETGHDKFIHVLATLNVSFPVKHLHCFENLGNPYVLVAGEDTAVLYTIVNEEILESQLLQASDLGLRVFDDILTIPSGNYRGDTALLVTSGNYAVILTWQQHSFVLSKSFQISGGRWSSAAVLQTPDATEVVHVSSDGHVGVVSVRLALEQERDPLSEQNDRMQSVVAGLQEKLSHHDEVLKGIFSRLRRSVTLSSTIRGHIRITGEVLVQSARAQRLSLNHVTVSSANGAEQSLEEQDNLMRAEQHALLEASSRLNATDRQIRDGILHNMEEVVVSGPITFSSLSTQQLAANNVVMNGKVLEDVVQDLVDVNGVHFIVGQTTIVSPLAISSLIATSLDGIPVADFVSESDDVTLGRVKYQNGLTVLGEILVTKGLSVGGADLARAMTVSGRNLIDRCAFSKVDAVGGINVTDNRVNGVDIVGLGNSVLNKSHSAVIEGSLLFTNTISIEGTVYASTVMGVDVLDLFTTAVYKTSASTTIESSITFTSRVEVDGSVEVAGLINGRLFPVEYPTSSSQSIRCENKEFEEMTVDTMNVLGLVDGISTRDLITLSSDQSITGIKTFSAGIDVEGNLDISSATVDGVNLAEIEREAGKMKKQTVSYNVIFEKKTILHRMEVSGTVNNMNIVEIAEDLLLANEKLAKIFGTKVFGGDVSADHITVQEINGVSFGNFVDSGKKITVSGVKKFEKGFSCARLSVRGSTAGINVTHLFATSLYVNKPGQVVSGKKFFIDSIRASRVIVAKDVNGVDFSKDVATRTANHSFKDEQIFTSTSFKELSTLYINLEKSKLINKVDVSALANLAVYLDEDQILLEPVVCTGGLTFTSSLKSKYVNEVNLDEFVYNLAQSDQENFIVADLQIKNLTVTANLSTFNLKGINGFNLSQLDKSAVKLDAELLDLSAVWENVIFEDDVTLGGLLNGYDLVELHKDAVFSDHSSPIYFSGLKTMSGQVEITGNLSSPSINGLDLERDVLSRSTNQIITAPYAFKTLIADNLDLVGTFNGMNLTDLIETRLGANMLLEGPVTFYDDISVTQLEVGGRVNDVSIGAVMADAILINNGGADILGKKVFARIPRFSSLDVRNLNGDDLAALLLDLVRADEDNHFSKDVTIASVSASLVLAGTVTVQGDVDGVNSTELLADLVFLDQDERIPRTANLRFADLQIGEEVQHGELLTRSLNSRDTHDGYLLADQPQDFDFNVSFTGLTSGNVSVGGHVNDWDLNLFEESLKITGGQEMFGDMVFDNVRVLTSFSVSKNLGRRNGALIGSKDVVPLNTESILVKGCLKFESAVTAGNLWSASNVVNGYDVDDMMGQAWRTNSDSLVDGNFTFSGPVYFESETTLGVNGLSSLVTMQEEVDTIRRLTQKPTTSYRERYLEQCQKGSVFLDLLSHGSENQDSLLEVFNSSLAGRSLRPGPLIVEALNTTLAFMPQVSNSCSVAVHRWAGPIIGFQHWYNVDDVGEVADWVHLSGIPSTLVAVAVRQSVNCPAAASVILQVTGDTIKVTQELKGFDSVSYDRSGSAPLLHVGSIGPPRPNSSYSYTWSEEDKTFTEVSTNSYALVRSVISQSGRVGWLRLAGGGVLAVGEDSTSLAEVVVEDVVDAGLLYQDQDLLVLLVTKQTVLDVATFHFYVLRQSTVTGSMLVQDWLPLPSAASVSVLREPSVADEVSHLVALVAESSPLVLYKLKGNGQLRSWSPDLPDRNVSWVDHFTSDGQLYLLLQDSSSYLSVHKIVTAGQRLESRRPFPVCGI